MLADLFDPGTLVGWFGLIAGPLALVMGGLAAYKVQDAARWRVAAAAEKAARDAAEAGLEIRDDRIRSTNEWAATIEARYREREALVAALNERVSAQAEHIRARDEHIAQLLERTPEKLWEAVEAHSKAAEQEWHLAREWNQKTAEAFGDRLEELERRLEQKLDGILDRLKRIEPD